MSIRCPKRRAGALVEAGEEECGRGLHRGRGNDRNREILDDLQELLSSRVIAAHPGASAVSISGARAVASGVTFIDGEPAKSAYRKFRVRTVEARTTTP